MMMHIRGTSPLDPRTASKGLDDALDRSLADCFSLPPDALPVDEHIHKVTAYDTDTVPTTNVAHAHRANDSPVDDHAVEHAIGDVVSLSPMQYAKKRAFASPIWGTMLGSGIAAVITGGLFGSALLSLAAETATPPPPISQSSFPNGAAVPVSVPMTSAEHAQETTTLTAPQNEAPKMTTGGQPPSLYVIQYGVFRQQSGARERIRQLHTQGVAAVMSATSPYRVYGAVIPDRNQAIAFGHMLRQADAEVLVKGWEWPLAAAVQRVAALPRSDIPDFITQNRHVMQWYSAQSSARLLSKEIPRTVETGVPSFVQARVPLQKTSTLLPQETVPRRNPVHAKMDDCFIRAFEAWDAYTKRPLRRYLWDIQQQMLRYVALEHTFFMQEALSVSHNAPLQSTPHTEHIRTR